ncbi:MAG: iron chaperone [Micromonosporaceae bacterium]
MPAVDDYFGGLDASTRAAFEHVRDLVMDMVPEAEQGTSYGMAALKYKKKPLIAFLAAKQHLSVFPFSSRVVDAVRDRLTGFELSKGTIRFTAATPLPDEVVRDIVRHRMEEIDGSHR